MYRGSRDREKREALERIVEAASEERGAFMNCDTRIFGVNTGSGVLR